MNNKIIFWSIIAALAGFLFGFDTVVISGAEGKLQALWHSSDTFHGIVVVGMALWGTVIGALSGGYFSNTLGRKKSLIWIGVFYTISAIGSSLANDPITFAIFRFIGGIGVGASTVAAPSYISEVVSAKNRGKYVGLYQFNIVFGILVAYFSNYLFNGIGENDWRWMVGIEALPAFIYTILAFLIPKSPRWLIIRKKYLEVAKEIKTIYPHFSDTDIQGYIDDVKAEKKETKIKETIFDRQYRFSLSLAFLIAFFNQFSGINAFLYYAPRIFEEAGIGEQSAFLSSIGVGAVNLIFTLLGISLIDRYGRKNLMYLGSIGYIISLTLVSASFFFLWKGSALPLFFFLFIASHAMGQGTVIWVYISEIFPNHLRGAGQSFGTSVHWILAAVIPSSIPLLISNIGGGTVFAIFAFMMMLQLLFVIFVMPETKGVKLEILSQQLKR